MCLFDFGVATPPHFYVDHRLNPSFRGRDEGRFGISCRRHAAGSVVKAPASISIIAERVEHSRNIERISAVQGVIVVSSQKDGGLGLVVVVTSSGGDNFSLVVK